MASLDIAERRVPQDGRIKLNISKTKQMDFRMSTCPTLFGEKVVLRLLDGSAAKLGIDKLGYEDNQKQLYLDALAKPYGMILVTGPTGSGKTVSLYTGLNILNTEERNISTAEDPVEIRVPGINQVQMSNKKGMTFAVALRSFLRQDPDVVMVGEIRDRETADIAVQAALTGHLVLTTVHTNDAIGAITRLRDMKVEPFLIASTVRAVLAQRLVRRLCPSCRQPVEATGSLSSLLGVETGTIVYEPKGCPACNGSGYKGRVGLFEAARVDDEVRRLINAGADEVAIEAHAFRNSDTLTTAARALVRDGVTSPEEAVRVSRREAADA